MRYFKIIVLMLFFYSCNHVVPHKEVFGYPKLKDAFFVSFALTQWNQQVVYAYDEFDNTETKEMLNAVYEAFGGDLNYNINDSISNFILNRKNRKITEKTTDIKGTNVVMITDTTIYNNYVVLSEPFSIDDKWMLFSISRKDSSKTRKHYFVYVKKSNKDLFDVSVYYDWQKDKLFKGTLIK